MEAAERQRETEGRVEDGRRWLANRIFLEVRPAQRMDGRKRNLQVSFTSISISMSIIHGFLKTEDGPHLRQSVGFLCVERVLVRWIQCRSRLVVQTLTQEFYTKVNNYLSMMDVSILGN